MAADDFDIDDDYEDDDDDSDPLDNVEHNIPWEIVGPDDVEIVDDEQT